MWDLRRAAGLLAPLVQSRWSRLFQQSVAGLARHVDVASARERVPGSTPAK